MRVATAQADARACATQEFTEENFRGLRNWAAIFNDLKAAKIKSVSPEAANAAIRNRRVRGCHDRVTRDNASCVRCL